MASAIAATRITSAHTGEKRFVVHSKWSRCIQRALALLVNRNFRRSSIVGANQPPSSRWRHWRQATAFVAAEVQRLETRLLLSNIVVNSINETPGFAPSVTATQLVNAANTLSGDTGSTCRDVDELV